MTTKWNSADISPKHASVKAAVEGLRSRAQAQAAGPAPTRPEADGIDWGSHYSSWSPPSVE